MRLKKHPAHSGTPGGKKAPPGKPLHQPVAPFFREVQIEFLVHELKGPISVVETGIRMLIEKQKTYGPLSPRQESTLRRSLRNAQKAREMINHLLEIGRSEAGCFLCTPFRPVQAVNDVLFDTLECTPGAHLEKLMVVDRNPDHLPQFGIYLTVSAPVSDLEINQDEVKFRQIVGNLVQNALHHRKERIDIDVGRTADRLRVEVCDDGPGIKPEHHESVFRRYVQVNDCSAPANRTGHGLGLAGAAILARCLGGNIELISDRGKGARFRLLLPTTMESDR